MSFQVVSRFVVMSGPARRAYKAPPTVNRPALDVWPSRVCIVPYGRRRVYHGDAALAADGQGHQLEVASPSCLMDWANHQSPVLAYACWDLLAWLPFDPALGPRGGKCTGLSGNECWSTVYDNELFKELLREIASHPCHLVMSGAQMLGGHSVWEPQVMLVMGELSVGKTQIMLA